MYSKISYDFKGFSVEIGGRLGPMAEELIADAQKMWLDLMGKDAVPDGANWTCPSRSPPTGANGSDLHRGHGALPCPSLGGAPDPGCLVGAPFSLAPLAEFLFLRGLHPLRCVCPSPFFFTPL
jgi:hypothetical protein